MIQNIINLTLSKNMLSFNYKDELQHYSDKFNSNNILNDINKIEVLEEIMIIWNHI